METPSTIKAADLTAWDDTALEAARDEMQKTADYCIRQCNVVDELDALVSGKASVEANRYLANRRREMTDAEQNWSEAIDAIVAEQCRRTEAAEAEAHKVHILTEAAAILRNEQMVGAARTCESLAGIESFDAEYGDILDQVEQFSA